MLAASCTAASTPHMPAASPQAAVSAPAGEPSEAPAAAHVSAPADTGTPLPAAPSPTPKPVPTPSPTPAPTAAPDPWADKFSPDGAYLKIGDAMKGPWIYKDATLSITVTVPKTGFMANRYLLADIYTRKELPVGVFAFANDGKKRSTALPYKIARQNRAVLGITGDYISSTANLKGVMIRGGVVYHDKASAPTLAFLPSGEMKIYEPGETTAAKLLELGVRDSFAFGPILVKDGRIHKTVEGHKLNYHSYRAAIGQVEPGHFIMISTRAAITLTDLAKIFIGLHCGIAYNMDGGYSAAMVFMGEQLNKNTGSVVLQRKMPDLMAIGFDPAVPAPNAPVYCDGVNIHPGNKPKPTDGLLK